MSKQINKYHDPKGGKKKPPDYCLCLFFIHAPCFLMCILFYVFSIWIHVYVLPIHTMVHCGVPSSQALPGYLITAPPSVCVPDVIGALACGFQAKKKKRLRISSNPRSISESGLPYYCAPLVRVPDVLGLLAVTVWRHNKPKSKTTLAP